MTPGEFIMRSAFGFLAGIFLAEAYYEGMAEWYLASVACLLIAAAS
jgi:hypothetical protein